MKSLHKHLDPNQLPANYGGMFIYREIICRLREENINKMPLSFLGNLPAINYGGKDWYQCINDYEDHIRMWNDYGFANQIP